MQIATKAGLVRIAIAATLFVGGGLAFASCCLWMPGVSFRGPLPRVTSEHEGLARALKNDVTVLASAVGERNGAHPANLARALTHLHARLADLAPVIEQDFTARGSTFANLAIEVRGTRAPQEIVIVGAHYDTAPGTPGANDNGTGVASALALAAHFREHPAARTIRFELFANEEPPWFNTDDMGSRRAAKLSQEKHEQIVAMFALETMGSFSDVPHTQRYPFPLSLFYPSTGDFIAFVGDLASTSLVRHSVETFRAKAQFPSEGAALPRFLPGVGWSDHASYWAIGVPAVMVTDTAPFRYAHYHRPTDVPAQVDFDRLARVTLGLVSVVDDLANAVANGP